MFDFEKLDVYQLSLEFCGDIEKILAGIPKSEFALIDQLKRAALSIPLNIAEACGRRHTKERMQHFFFSRGSAFECVPILTMLEQKKMLSKEFHAELRTKLTRLVQMLTKLAQSSEKSCS